MRVIALVAALALAVAAGPALAAPTAPAFTIRLLDGSGTLDSRNLIGKKVLVVRFQASWCKPCAAEAPAIERTWQKYRPRGVEVVGIHVQDTAADARHFLRAQGATYPAGLDPHLAIAGRFGFKGTPYTVVVNKRGEVAERISGRSSEARLTRALDVLLQERPAHRPPPSLR